MLTASFSKTASKNLLRFCQGKFLITIFVKTEKEGQKNEPLFLTGVAKRL